MQRVERAEGAVTPFESVQKRDLPLRLTMRDGSANYASPPPARLALMTYRRRDSFVTTPAASDDNDSRPRAKWQRALHSSDLTPSAH